MNAGGVVVTAGVVVGGGVVGAGGAVVAGEGFGAWCELRTQPSSGLDQIEKHMRM